MKIYFIVSEAAPLAKTGGLADVASSLPAALAHLGHDVRIVLPLYRSVNRDRHKLRATNHTLSVAAGATLHQLRVWETALPIASVPVYALECEPLFGREGLYQERGGDYPDNLERFSVFSQAALQLPPALGWAPDIVHAHDWQAALAVAHMRLGALGRQAAFAGTGTILTVHNLAYQGLFPRDQWPLTALPESAFSMDGLEFYGRINALKGGLCFADWLTTVSPTYRREVQTPEFGCGLDGLLRKRGRDMAGIVNGIDVDAWNPQTDPQIAARYSATDLTGKRRCKRALQKRLGLLPRPGLLIGMVQRLAEQKGVDIFVQALKPLMALPVQVALLGTGDPSYEALLQAAAQRFPGRLSINLTFDDALAHQIEAGADAFLMPSRFEPCGLNQMYSMRYGTAPIVRRVGGLADTVMDLTPKTRAAKTATGFLFKEPAAAALVNAVRRAVTAFGDRALWTGLMRTGMRKDLSWTRSARAYVEVYRRAQTRAQRQVG